MRDRLVATLWSSSARSARVARALLTPLGWMYGAVVSLRNLAYDRGWLRSLPVALPTISVGNLTVGGTGKTPVSAWIVSQLLSRHARPAIVLRGYGGDEPLVHARLNPGATVIVDHDRVRGIARARAGGATVAVLDDGFQHRRARRDADIILLSADRFGPVRPLPAGPWREPLTALRRATLVIVTRKSASPLRTLELLSQAMRYAPKASGAILYLAPNGLVQTLTGTVRTMDVLLGADVLAISSIGDPRAFESQLRNIGARIQSAAFADHHPFSAGDAMALAARVPRAGWAVCTLKDAVKLAPHWPREAPPLWYLSQRVIVEAGGEALESLFARFASRTMLDHITTPAAAGPTIDAHGT